MKEQNKGVIALLDTSIILHNIRLGKNEAKFGAGLIDSLRALKLAIGVDYIYCIGDSGHSSYRKKLLENYKGDRAVANKKLDDKASARLSEMRQFNKNLSKFNDIFFYRNIYELECDDILGILYRELTEEGYEVLICSADKDLYTAIPYRNLFDTKSGKQYDFENKLKGLSQTKFKMYQCLNGDSADSIIGFTGEKTSLMLVNHFKTFKAMQDFDLNKVLEIDGATTRNKHHIIKALTAIKEDVGLEKIKLNWELVSIFTDRSKLTEKQEREFEKLKQDLLSWKPSGGISEDLEIYLYEIGEAELMGDLEWGI